MCSPFSGIPAESLPDYHSTHLVLLDRGRENDGKSTAGSQLIAVERKCCAQLGGSSMFLLDAGRRLRVVHRQDSLVMLSPGWNRIVYGGGHWIAHSLE